MRGAARVSGSVQTPHEGAGFLLFARSTGRMLFLLREDGTWGIPGGVRDAGDRSLLDTALRELTEETGYDGPVALHESMLPYTHVYSMPDGTCWTFAMPGAFKYAVYEGTVPTEFVAAVDHEHEAFAWRNVPPRPTHPGVVVALRELR
jgi:8-oxo-dGTP pyrophosphatase MutT (NUDIX family)